MGGNNVKRKLTAILCADVVGYSRLTGADEEGTHEAVSGHLDTLAELIARHDGRVVHYAGDAVLADFASVVAAVRCAIEAQKVLADRNAGILDDRKVQFRMGVNLGDVIVDRNDIYGDGVNVAARLESLADAGGICISRKVMEEIRGKIDAGFEDMGPQAVKNIAEPVQAYRVVWEAQPAATSPPPLPDKPSVAVLPFVNLSDDPDQSYFADGISEDIITALARFPSLFVIARNSSFTYKARSVGIKQIGRELGVRYILEGSVRKAGNRVRITVELVQADDSMRIWGDRYDRELTDIFALQDEMAASVIGAIVPSLQSAEIKRAARRPPGSVDAYDCYLRALPKFYMQTEQSTTQALQLVEQALRLDPDFVPGIMLAENCWFLKAAHGWAAPQDAHPEVMRYARRAVQIDRNDAEALATLARRICTIERNYEEAVSLADQAVALNPNSATAWRQAGYALVYCGRPEAALEYLQHAIRLSPRDPRAEDCWAGIAIALIQLDRTEDAAAAARRAVQSNPNSAVAWRTLTAALALTGQTAEARTALQSLLAIDPNCSLTTIAKRFAYTEVASERYFEGLRKAGMPE